MDWKVKMSERFKVCWFCKYFRYYQADAGWSEETPGSDFSIDCVKNHWKFDPYVTSQEEFGKILSTAETCEDFKKK